MAQCPGSDNSGEPLPKGGEFAFQAVSSANAQVLKDQEAEERRHLVKLLLGRSADNPDDFRPELDLS